MAPATTSSSSTTNTANLPSSKSPSLRLAHPTPAEKLATWHANGAYWRGALEMEAYCRREEHLGSQPLTRNGAMTYWILVDTNKELPTDTDKSNGTEADATDTKATETKEEAIRTVLSSCETLRKRALVAHDNKVEDVVAQGVGSVFCEPHLRGRGYSSRMMHELARELTTHHRESGKCAFTVLFSDIGKKFYSTHGWHPFDSTHVALPPASTQTTNTTPARPLYADQLADLCEADEQLIRRYLTYKSKIPGKVHVALVPDVDTMQWHHSREEFIAKELYHRDPAIKGAIVGDEPGKRVWCIWTRTWASKDDVEDGGNVMQILRLVAEEHVLAQSNDLAVSHEEKSDKNEDGKGVNGTKGTASDSDSHLEEAIVSILQFAQEEATKWNMKEVNIWNPTDLALRAARRILPSAQVVDRESESITSLMWYGNGLDGVKEYPEHVVWVGNEKYGWC